MWWNDGTGYAMGWGGAVLMTLVMIAFWGLVVAGIWALFRTGAADRNAAPPSGERGVRAREILDERFANGDIDADEYRARRDELRTPPRGAGAAAAATRARNRFR